MHRLSLREGVSLHRRAYSPAPARALRDAPPLRRCHTIPRRQSGTPFRTRVFRRAPASLSAGGYAGARSLTPPPLIARARSFELASLRFPAVNIYATAPLPTWLYEVLAAQGSNVRRVFRVIFETAFGLPVTVERKTEGAVIEGW